MNPQQMERILERINELKALFIFGQRVIPFLEELFSFVQNIVPLMQEMNQSLHESSSKMPRASSQLNDVTRATELATNEILDILDDVLFKLGEIQSGLSQSREIHAKLSRLERKVNRLLARPAEERASEKWIQSVQAIQQQRKVTLKSLRRSITRAQNNLTQVKDSASDIMFSLQVQDITSQQIAAVNHLIESVRERIEHLLNQLQTPGPAAETEVSSIQPLPFDPQASYINNADRQQTADAIFAAPPTPGNPSFLQEEIDQLFQTNPPASDPAARNEKPAPTPSNNHLSGENKEHGS